MSSEGRVSEFARVTWYDHDCPWLTKFCDVNHVRTAWVPLDVVRRYESAPAST